MAIPHPTRLARIAGVGAVLALAFSVPAVATPGTTQDLTPEQGAVAVAGLSILADSPEYGVEFDRTINPFLGEQEPSGSAFSAGRANIQLGDDIEGLDDVDLDDVYFFTSIEDPFAIDDDSLLVTVEAPAEAVRSQFLDVALLVEQVAQPVAGADPNLELDPNEGFNTRASVSVTDGVPGTRYEQFVEGEWREFQMPFDAWVIPTAETAVIGLLAPARFVAGAPKIEVHVSGFPLDSTDTEDIFVHRTGNIVSTQIPILDAVALDPVRPTVEQIISTADLSTLSAAAGALPGGSGDDDLGQTEPTTTPVPSTTSPPATTTPPETTQTPATTGAPLANQAPASTATPASEPASAETTTRASDGDTDDGSVLPILIVLALAIGIVALLLWLLLWRTHTSAPPDQTHADGTGLAPVASSHVGLPGRTAAGDKELLDRLITSRIGISVSEATYVANPPPIDGVDDSESPITRIWFGVGEDGLPLVPRTDPMSPLAALYQVRLTVLSAAGGSATSALIDIWDPDNRRLFRTSHEHPRTAEKTEIADEPGGSRRGPTGGARSAASTEQTLDAAIGDALDDVIVDGRFIVPAQVSDPAADSTGPTVPTEGGAPSEPTSLDDPTPAGEPAPDPEATTPTEGTTPTNTTAGDGAPVDQPAPRYRWEGFVEEYLVDQHGQPRFASDAERAHVAEAIRLAINDGIVPDGGWVRPTSRHWAEAWLGKSTDSRFPMHTHFTFAANEDHRSRVDVARFFEEAQRLGIGFVDRHMDLEVNVHTGERRHYVDYWHPDHSNVEMNDAVMSSGVEEIRVS